MDCLSVSAYVNGKREFSKKIRTINTENVELELGEYEETTVLRNAQDTEKAQSVAVEEEKKSKQQQSI